MAIVRPFAALRPAPELASRICELPYDVLSSEEARATASGNPLSFLHVSKPEIDLPPGTDLYSPEVYATGKRNLRRLIDQGTLRQDPQPCFYLYRQVMGSHSQIGLAAVAACEEYLSGKIKKHELTRPDKEDDRVRHIETLDAQTGPVFLVYRSVAEIDELVSRRVQLPPHVDFTAADGVRHTAWTITEETDIAFLAAAFERVPSLYIADGHHRCAAAARVFRARGGKGHSGFFLSVIFPHDQAQILPYHRVVKDLNGLSEAQLLERLEKVFELESSGTAAAGRKHQVGLYLGGTWRTLSFRSDFTKSGDSAETLDVALLQRHVLGPLLGIEDPRTSQRINFVGGIRGTGELERLVDSGEYACAFSLRPTSIADLMSVAEAGGIMPPKSTWFEPKLRDAMFSHLI